MNIVLKIFLVFLCCIELSSCVTISNKYSQLPPGTWRAVLKIYDSKVDASLLDQKKSGLAFDELPFNFELKYDNEEQLYIEIINGEERIKVDDITIGLDRATAKDTVVINFPLYNSYIKAIHEEGIMEGHWFVKYKGEYSIPFIALHGQNHRFKVKKKENQVKNISGKWKTTFDFDKDDPYLAIAEFHQEGDKLTGTFRTETGDYRYLEGTVQNKKFFLSVFDGSHAFLFEGLIEDDENLVGTFKSGKHYESNFTAIRDDDFELEDPYNLSQIVDKNKAINFSFEDTEGKMVSLTDSKFQNKIKLVNIVGTWCPNCRDESKFLKKYIEENKSQNIEVLSICFEKFKEKEKSLVAMSKYKQHLGLEWPLLYGGIADKIKNQQVLPFIDKLISYPTLLIIDEENKIRYVHTGFSGPATSKFKEFESTFAKIMNSLIEE